MRVYQQQFKKLIKTNFLEKVLPSDRSKITRPNSPDIAIIIKKKVLRDLRQSHDRNWRRRKVKDSRDYLETKDKWVFFKDFLGNLESISTWIKGVKHIRN